MSFRRADRVAEILREEYARVLLEDIRDPRLKDVTITRLELSSDLKHGKIFFSVLKDTDDNRVQAMAGMKSAQRYCKRELGRRCKLRIIPELSFHYDDTIKYSIHMSELFRQIEKENADKKDDGDKTE